MTLGNPSQIPAVGWVAIAGIYGLSEQNIASDIFRIR